MMTIDIVLLINAIDDLEPPFADFLETAEVMITVASSSSENWRVEWLQVEDGIPPNTMAAIDTIGDICSDFQWRPQAMRVIYYWEGRPTECQPNSTSLTTAINQAIASCKLHDVTIYINRQSSLSQDLIDTAYNRLATETGGQAVGEKNAIASWAIFLEYLTFKKTVKSPVIIPRNIFKIGTFNLYNLVLPNRTYYETRQYTPELYQQKKAWISHQLATMQADIIGFQEIFDPEALQEILAATESYHNAHLITTNPTRNKPVVGLCSKLPIISWQIYDKFPPESQIDIEGTMIPINHFSRPVLAVNIQLQDSLQCTVFVVHLKSQRPKIPEGVDSQNPVEKAKGKVRSLLRRAAEATALRCIMLKTWSHSQNPIILLGDFNDSDLAITTKIMAGDISWKKTRFKPNHNHDELQLYSVKDIQARQSYRDCYYTYMYNGYYETLDHILVSQELVLENSRQVGKVSYVALFNDHLVDQSLSDESIEPWKSDHGQVVATIQLNGYS
ncbi:MAG: endonuclease/exonuclease/phosphatase family protein [Limnospira maxima]